MGRIGVCRESAVPWIPVRPTLPKLRAAAKNCRGCQLWKRGTQAVFGEGARASRVVFVGEQPGDREDIEGRPFVGPAGKLLDRARHRGEFARSDLAPYVMATVHPSSLLRAPDDATRRRETVKFVRDLEKVRRALET